MNVSTSFPQNISVYADFDHTTRSCPHCDPSPSFRDRFRGINQILIKSKFNFYELRVTCGHSLSPPETAGPMKTPYPGGRLICPAVVSLVATGTGQKRPPAGAAQFQVACKIIAAPGGTPENLRLASMPMPVRLGLPHLYRSSGKPWRFLPRKVNIDEYPHRSVKKAGCGKYHQ